MIIRSKLVEQLRDFQVRSQHKCSALTIFSPKPFLSSWHFWVSFFILGLIIFRPIRVRSFRQVVAKKREMRSFLPLSMWTVRNKYLGAYD